MFIPLGIFFVIFNSQIFVVAILSYFILNERLSAFESIAMIFAFFGIVMIGVSKVNTDPTLEGIQMFGLSKEDLFRLGVFLAVSSAIFGSLSGILTRQLKEVNFAVI